MTRRVLLVGQAVDDVVREALERAGFVVDVEPSLQRGLDRLGHDEIEAVVSEEADRLRVLAQAVARREADLQVSQDSLTSMLDKLQRYARRLEDQLHDSEEKYRSLFEQAHDAIFIADEQMRIIDANEGAEALIGRPHAEIVGHTVIEWVAAADRERVGLAIAELMSHGGARVSDVRMERPDGKPLIIEASAAIVQTKERRLVVGIAHDVSERHRAEEALRQSEERFRNLVDSIDDWVFTYDTDQRITGTFGRAWERLNRPTDYFLGKNIVDLLGIEQAAVHLEATRKTLQGTPTSYAWSIDRGAGLRHYHTTLAPLRDAEGAVVGVVGIGRDVTLERQTQAQLMVADRMATIGTLAAGVAHEVNNPLAVVIGNIELALGRLGKGKPVDEPLGQALEAAERVRVIVRDLKVFSRSEEQVTDAVDVHVVLESSLRMAYNELRHRARITRDYAATGFVQANEARLGQVFLNLLVNAAQAIAEGRADDNRVHLRTSSVDGRVVVEVSDTGAGIAPELLPRLFTPFFTTKAIGVGTGLGLSICQRIVNDMGGSISVDTALGQGTTFRVALPASQAAPLAKVSAPKGPTRRRSVLVIDDEPSIGVLVAQLLGDEHDVHVALRAEDALARIGVGERFDAILCDVMMPQMSGPEFYRALQQRAPALSSRVIFMTGGAFTPQAQRFLEQLAGHTVLDKPFSTTALREALQDLTSTDDQGVQAGRQPDEKHEHRK